MRSIFHSVYNTLTVVAIAGLLFHSAFDGAYTSYLESEKARSDRITEKLMQASLKELVNMKVSEIDV